MNMDHTGHDANTTTTTKVCPMIMHFHANHCERVLWNSWVAETVAQFTLSALALFALAFLYEVLKFIRELHMRKVLREQRDNQLAIQAKGGNPNEGSCSSTPLQSNSGSLNWKERMLSNPHLVQSILNLFQVSLSYFLMLVFMLFNYWLCLAVILGLGLGYFCFGWIKQEVTESDCCH